MTATAMVAHEDQMKAARKHLARAIEALDVDLHRGVEAWHEGVCEAIRAVKECSIRDYVNQVRDERSALQPPLLFRWADAPETAWVLTLDDDNRVNPPVDHDRWLRANRPAPTRDIRCAWCNGPLPAASYQHIQVVVSDLTFIALPTCNRCPE